MRGLSRFTQVTIAKFNCKYIGVHGHVSSSLNAELLFEAVDTLDCFAFKR